MQCVPSGCALTTQLLLPCPPSPRCDLQGLKPLLRASAQLPLWLLRWQHTFAPLLPLHLAYPRPQQLSGNFSRWVTGTWSLISRSAFGKPSPRQQPFYTEHILKWTALDRLERTSVGQDRLASSTRNSFVSMVPFAYVSSDQLCVGFIIELGILMFPPSCSPTVCCECIHVKMYKPFFTCTNYFMMPFNIPYNL